MNIGGFSHCESLEEIVIPEGVQNVIHDAFNGCTSLEIIDLSKTSIIQYSKIVFVFVLGVIFLGQEVFFSDILGSSIIVGFMIYHVLNPVK